MRSLLEDAKAFRQKTLKDLQNRQETDGSWRFCFEGPVMTNSFLILLLTSLGDHDSSLISSLARRIRSEQNEDGTFRNYPDEAEGHLTATVQGYTGMLASGIYSRDEPHMQKAEAFIRSKGGLRSVHFMTKWMLAANGLYPWPRLYLPLSFLLIPPVFPLHFYHFSAYARIHFVPMAIALNKKYVLKNEQIGSLRHLDENMSKNPLDWLSIRSFDERNFYPFNLQWKELLKWPVYVHNLGFEAGKRYMLDRIEQDGTLYSYASATIFMVYSLLSLGISKNDPVIRKAVSGVKGLVAPCGGEGLYVENSTSTVWDTALLSYAMQEAGMSQKSPTVSSAADYLEKRQHIRKADWAVFNPHAKPGGWGFSNLNTNNPDVDDTAAALKAIPLNRRPADWTRGLAWLLSMQNKDGGFAAFEKNVDHPLIRRLPIESADEAAVDPSTADLTGRALHALGLKAGYTENHSAVRRALHWLYRRQEKNGSWYGRWGVCYIYGTWAALTGMKAVGVSGEHPSVKKALSWLKSIQLPDGSWGESCKSCEIKTFAPLAYGTAVQTAWALEALLQYEDPREPLIQKGFRFLIDDGLHQPKHLVYPTGIGLPKQFYIYYHSYPFVFPLLALSAFIKQMEMREKR
ncbi:squalene--hopene cyclase [Bacillus sonorensis]|uniref:Squalene-hopene cyclase n=1 Tax=Bacillus sonorensis L12 TaxID=1274524 RepID=M5PHV6_9BACI|nr:MULTISPECIES: prenyltransferase/squalene oxidase repeat-containing protein [Bacillus]TWK82399.1 Sporulenol synthase [Bacillus paralicheniformis]EME76332.1 squalene-hopene cyclase [Bacillus sonorensis L12]MCF7618213.1 squalene--hopene cyclase [Bacillus sonorensis]MCY7856933.1 squalene--hopene cyclase [Bacillus sonorensis]MCY8089470.1 squalene--hopene cyclase [Bacillus sonorensis]